MCSMAHFHCIYFYCCYCCIHISQNSNFMNCSNTNEWEQFRWVREKKLFHITIEHISKKKKKLNKIISNHLNAHLFHLSLQYRNELLASWIAHRIIRRNWWNGLTIIHIHKQFSNILPFYSILWLLVFDLLSIPHNLYLSLLNLSILWFCWFFISPSTFHCLHLFLLPIFFFSSTFIFFLN